MSVPLVFISIVSPLLISKYTNGASPILYWMKAMPIRLIANVVCIVFIYFTPQFKDHAGQYSYGFYSALLALSAVMSVVDTCMSTLLMAFFATRTDSSGASTGTYITFLNTLTNLGTIYPSTIALYLINLFTVKYCSEKKLLFLHNSTEFALQQNITGNSDLTLLIESIHENTCSSTAKSKVDSLFALFNKAYSGIDLIYY